MASGNLKIRAKSEGLDRLEREFEGLTKAQQRVVLKGSAVGKEFQNMERRGREAMRRVKDETQQTATSVGRFEGAVGKLAGGLTVAGIAGAAAYKAIALGIDQVTRAEENRRRVMRDAAEGGQRSGQSIGSLYLNAGDLAADPNESQRVLARLTDIAVRSGRDRSELISALATIRPATGSATDDERLDALEVAFRAKLLDEDFDAEGFASAVIEKVQSDRKRGKDTSIKQAADSIFAIADRAGLDTNEIGGPISQLIGAEATGATLDELAGMLAFYTAKTKKGGESGIESIVPFVTKLASNETFKIAGKTVRLEGDTPIAKLKDFLKRKDAGEFGTNGTRAIADLVKGGGGTYTELLVNQIDRNREEFFETLEAGSSSGNGLDQRIDATRRADPTFDARLRAMEAEAQASTADATDVSSATLEQQARVLDARDKMFGRDPDNPNSVGDYVYFKLTPGASNPAERRRQQLADGRSFDDIEDEQALGLLSQLNPYGPMDPESPEFVSNLKYFINQQGPEAAARRVLGDVIDPSDGLSREEQGALRLARAPDDLIRFLQMDAEARASMTQEQTRLIVEALRELNLSERDVERFAGKDAVAANPPEKRVGQELN